MIVTTSPTRDGRARERVGPPMSVPGERADGRDRDRHILGDRRCRADRRRVLSGAPFVGRAIDVARSPSCTSSRVSSRLRTPGLVSSTGSSKCFTNTEPCGQRPLAGRGESRSFVPFGIAEPSATSPRDRVQNG